MVTTIRICLGEVELECVGDEAFVADRLPQLVAELIRQLTSQALPIVAPQQAVAQSSAGPGLFSIAGLVRDYWSDVVVAGAKVKTVGLNPELSGETDATGRFVISGETPGRTGLIAVTGPDGYVETATGPIELSPGVSNLVLPAVPRANLNLLYTVYGIQPDQNESTVIVNLLTAAGDPLEMVSNTDIGLKQGGNQVGQGPLFFGPSGNVDPSMVISQAFDNQARAVFFSVPEGITTLWLTAPGADGSLHQAEVPPVSVLKSAVTVLTAQLTA